MQHGWIFLLLLLTSGLGILMLRHHRLIVLQTLISRANSGKFPALFWVARYYVAAILLAFPGILTDILAVFFLIPWRGEMAHPVSADDVIEAEFTREKPTRDIPPEDTKLPHPDDKSR